ncbi:acyltransferase family protein [Akkermansiaceae bacterium]|nr:acyltransferase family protein [Akkermansiaceae bacterium]
MSEQRSHFLDGLRGGAMLLGLVLHGVLSFAGIGAWLAADVKSVPEIILPFIDWIHGFRMPLFFMVSGFFTTMVWRKRGTGGVVKQRLLRIGVPLVLGVIVIFPLMTGLWAWGEQVKKERRELAGPWRGYLPSAVLRGELEEVRELLRNGGDSNGRDGNGTPLLHLAAIIDDGEMAEFLLEQGADLEGRGMDGGTALMTACFFGREEAALALLEAGADVSAKDSKGATAMQAAKADFEFVKAVAGQFQIEVTAEHESARERLVGALEDAGAEGSGESDTSWYWAGVFWPVFHHLWFLYDLLWLLLFFVPAALIAKRLGRRLPDFMISVPGCLLWLIPLTWWLQNLMPGQFGPGTSTGIFPWPVKLAYYGVFFFFGALCFGRGFWEERVGARWWVWLLASLPFWGGGREWVKNDPLWGSLMASCFAWLTIVGMMGLFRRFLNEGRPKVRYLSDSSYWLYLAHLPVMIAVQIWISDWEIPVILKMVIVIGGVTGLLLLIYEFAVRYTWIGALLNGRKSRPVTPPPQPGAFQ